MKTRRLVYLLFCLAVLGSCRQGRPARKELPPSLSMLPEIGATVTPYPSRWSLNSATSSDYLFYSTDTSLLTNGIRQNFLVLSLPDPTLDSAVGELISAGQSLAPYLLTQLHSLKKAGIVIDLRLSDNSSTIRQDYQATSTTLKETNLPIIFLFDRETSGRAAFFSQYLEQFPDITWSITNDRPRYQSDCFKDVHPTF
jgi:hypothetical protein